MKAISIVTLSLLTLSASICHAAEIQAPAPVIGATLPGVEPTLQALDSDAAHNFETLPLLSNDSRYCIPFIKLGNSDNLVSMPHIEGVSASDFVISEDYCEQDCRQFTREILGQNQICKVPVVFRPNSVGEKQAILVLSMGDASTQYALIGTGYSAEAANKESPKTTIQTDETASAAKDTVSKVEKSDLTANNTKSSSSMGASAGAAKGGSSSLFSDKIPSLLNLPPVIPSKTPITPGKGGDSMDFSMPVNDENCSLYRNRQMQMSTSFSFMPGARPAATPMSGAESEFSRACDELRRQRQADATAERERQAAAAAQAAADAATQVCREITGQVQSDITQRNMEAENCSRVRQNCLNADAEYQSCTHGFFAFLGCNSEHRAKNAACNVNIDVFSSRGAIDLRSIRDMQCTPFYSQTFSDPICTQHRNYHEANCPTLYRPLEMEERLHWYCRD